MSYTAQTINVGDTITSAWGNKIEQHLERLGNYLGVVTDTAALPDPSTVDEGDWYLLSNKRGIYVMQGGEWRAIVDESLVKLWIGEPGASIQWSGGSGLLTVDSQVPLQKANLELYPITLVNLLGKYGNFETDSNDDGLADGWTKDPSSTCSIITGIMSSSAQQLKIYNNNGATEWPYIHSIVNNYSTNEGQVFFYSAYIKKLDSDNPDYSSSPYNPYLELKFYDASNTIIGTSSKNTSNTSWTRVYATAIAPSNTTKLGWIRIGHRADDLEFCGFVADGFMIVDLTKMGTLPPPLQQFFSDAGITRWDELATTSNITGADDRTQTGEDWLAELLPYVDSVQTVGYSFVNGQLTVQVENRGKNLWNDDKIQIITVETPPAGDHVTRIGAHEWRVVDSSTSAGFVFVLPVSLRKGTTYTLRIRSTGSISIGSLYFDPKVEKTLFPLKTIGTTIPSDYSTSFTYNGDLITGYFKIATYYSGTSNGTIYDIQLEESFSASEYEPAREDKVELSDVELFGYHGTYDELKGKTLVKRWDKWVLNGSADEVWGLDTTINTNYAIAYISYSNFLKTPVSDQKPICVNAKGVPLAVLEFEAAADVSQEAVRMWQSYSASLQIYIPKTEFTGTTIAELQTYLQANPYTLIYQLASPEYKTLEESLELPIIPGKNHIVLSDLATATITSTTNAVRAASTIITESNLTPNLIISNTEPQLKIPNRTLWYDTNANALKLWDGTSWITI